MSAQLVALDDGASILLDKPILLVGRHPECDIQIDSRKISRRHCCLAQVNDYLVVRDLGSTNGVRINDVRVLEGRLTEGDELTLGNHRYRVSWELETPPRRAPQAAEVKPPPRATVIDDELLENCDEPVALPESNLRPVPRVPRPAARDDASLILPDQLDLMPSDIFPNAATPASHPGS